MAATAKCSQCTRSVDLALGEHTTNRFRGARVIFCDDDCEADFFRPDDEPIDYDEQDRRAASEERIQMIRDEY